MPASQTSIRVRYAETDQMGVVYYANFFVWFEVGRVELLRQLGFHYKQMEIDDDCHIPVVEANCRYKSPARYDDHLLLETSVLTLRRSVIKFGYRLLRPESDGVPPTLLAERKQTVLARIGRVYGAWQAKQDGKAQAPERKKHNASGAGHECRLDHFSCRGNKRADARQP
jgi:acyl-CoA thioester hydrolase